MSVPTPTSATDPGATPGTNPGGSDARQVPAPVSGDKTYTQTEVENLIKERLARQKDTMEGQAAAAREKADREAAEQKAKEQNEYRSLAESEKARADKAEAEKADSEARTRDRITKTEVRAAAVGLNAVDPDDVYALLDKSKVEYSDDGEPTNIPVLVTALLDAKPHLVAGAATGGALPIPRTPKGSMVTRDQQVQAAIEAKSKTGRYVA